MGGAESRVETLKRMFDGERKKTITIARRYINKSRDIKRISTS